jgi:short-subunit dehydrogenase
MVTGASRGIGLHIARVLADQGMHLALVARDRSAIEHLAAELTLRTGARTAALVCDLSDSSRLDGMIEAAEAKLGAIDVLINNAGIDRYRFYPEESDFETEQMLRVNLLCPMLLTRKLLPKMIACKSGHVINMASIAGKASTPYGVSYASAKGGLIAFTHSIRAELRGTGVSASVISPGIVTAEGMFAKHERAHGVRVNRLVGTSSAERVARAVLQALHHDPAEIVVDPRPVRLMQVLQQFAPDVVSWLQERSGVNGMLRMLAVHNRDDASAAEKQPS